MKNAFAIVVCLVVLAGCDTGPPNGIITGQVSLDGKPVDGGMIRFVPVNGDSQPADSPITAGAYSVTMPVGEKKVEITWGKLRGGGEAATDTAAQGSDVYIEMIPAKYYGTETTLRYEVVEGEQKKDFPLESK